MVKLLARCYLKVGDWQLALQDDWNEQMIPQILKSYLAATQCDKEWYKAWHAWAFANFEVLNFYEKQSAEPLNNQILVSHVISSLQGMNEICLTPTSYSNLARKNLLLGFFRSISLSKGNSLQDTLRLLTLWFKYGHHSDVNSAISESFGSVLIDTWLQVIPQVSLIYIIRCKSSTCTFPPLSSLLLVFIPKLQMSEDLSCSCSLMSARSTHRPWFIPSL